MNITDILKTLCEAAEVNKIKTSVGDKVPASVMDALIKNAKETQRGKFFDNEAMAIINSISRGNDDPFLLSSPNAVHSILKKLKRGNSSFKADEILSGGKGKSYWKELKSYIKMKLHLSLKLMNLEYLKLRLMANI